jgi:transcriptional regulator with XRE-family HTH domain
VRAFDLPGALRRIRRIADLSQRELAAAAGLSPSTIGQVETGRRDLPVRLLVELAAVAGLAVALVDDDGTLVPPMAGAAIRDMGNRRFPAHLDTRYSDEGWWHAPHRYDRDQPWYTFDRDRRTRDRYRRRNGFPDDHQLPRPGDSPQERSAARRRAAARARAEDTERRFLAGEFRHIDDTFTCSCPPRCDELDDGSGRPVHTEDCPCSCDLG